MENYLEKVKSFIKKAKIETLLLALSLIISILTILLQSKTNNNINQKENEIIINSVSTFDPSFIFVDISGGINKPGLHKLKESSRFKDIIDSAGGLSSEADRDYFTKNFNLARILSDQEKIYIPTKKDIQEGLYGNIFDKQKTINTQILNQSLRSIKDQGDKININAASMSELEALPGVGPVTAQRIIDNRPFLSMEELTNKKIVNKSVYEKIKDSIGI